MQIAAKQNLSHQRDHKTEEQNYVFDGTTKTMCYAGSSSKQLLTTLSSTLENEIFAANISSLTENENSAKILDEEMCELDCRKRAGEKDGSSDLAVQVKIIFL